MAAHQVPPSLGFSRQEHWSGLPFPSPMHESEKWKWSCSVVSDPKRPHGLQPTRLLRPWDFPGKSTGVGCHCFLRVEGLGFMYIMFNYRGNLKHFKKWLSENREWGEERWYECGNCPPFFFVVGMIRPLAEGGRGEIWPYALTYQILVLLSV